MTLMERMSKLTFIQKLPDQQVRQVSNAVVMLLRPYKSKVLNITAENGKEFAQQQRIAGLLQANVYFDHLYHSWKRGLNENTNGLLRQYFPKRSDFIKIKDDSVAAAIQRFKYAATKNI